MCSGLEIQQHDVRGVHDVILANSAEAPGIQWTRGRRGRLLLRCGGVDTLAGVARIPREHDEQTQGQYRCWLGKA